MYLNLYISPLIFGIGGGEMVLIIGVILMLFGSDKIPEMARGLARVINQVKSASNELKSEITKSVDETGVINDIKEAVNVEDIKKRIGIDDINQAMEPLYTSRPDLERSGMGFTVMETFMDELQVESKKGMGTRVVIKKKFNMVS